MRGRITILIVDDNEGVRKALKSGLSRKGYALDEAGNGRQALEKISKNRPDLILLDGRMPIMDGFKTCRCLRKNPQTKDIPIIFCSGTSVTPAKRRGIRADDYIEKPLSLDNLFKKISKILKKRKINCPGLGRVK